VCVCVCVCVCECARVRPAVAWRALMSHHRAAYDAQYAPLEALGLLPLLADRAHVASLETFAAAHTMDLGRVRSSSSSRDTHTGVPGGGRPVG
jgi:hypothetical protein